VENTVICDTEKTCPVKVIGTKVLLRKLSNNEVAALFNVRSEPSLIIIPDSIQELHESPFCYCELISGGAQAIESCRAQGVGLGSIVMIDIKRHGHEFNHDGARYIVIDTPDNLIMAIEVNKES
jgi:hypothetical protein